MVLFPFDGNEVGDPIKITFELEKTGHPPEGVGVGLGVGSALMVFIGVTAQHCIRGLY